MVRPDFRRGRRFRLSPGMLMADDAGKRQPSSLDEFSQRLDAVRGAAANAENAEAEKGHPTGQSYRLSSELLAALIVGIGLGWGVDHLFGTRPWGFLAGIFLGFAAGVVNVARAMNAMKTDSADAESDESKD